MADDPDNYQVRALPNAGAGQLPEHTMGGQRVVRATSRSITTTRKNRIGAIAAHVTASDHEIHTPLERDAQTERFAKR